MTGSVAKALPLSLGSPLLRLTSDPRLSLSNLFMSKVGGLSCFLLIDSPILRLTSDITTVLATPSIPACSLLFLGCAPSPLVPLLKYCNSPPRTSSLTLSFGITYSPAVSIAGTLSIPAGPFTKPPSANFCIIPPDWFNPAFGFSITGCG